MADNKLWDEVQEIKKDQNATYAERWKEDIKLYFLDPYKLKDENDTELDGVENITMNHPQLLANKVRATLAGASVQPVIESPNDQKKDEEDKTCSKVEQAFNCTMDLANERLSNRGEAEHYTHITEQLVIIGSFGSKVNLKIKDKEFIADILPMDTRFFYPAFGSEGMSVGAYETEHKNARILEQYKDLDKTKKGQLEKMPKTGKSKLTDTWDSKKNYVFIGESGEIIYEEDNPHKHPPFMFQKSLLGSMLNDPEAKKHDRESIFWSNRDLFEQWNKMVTVLNTLNMMTFRGAVQYESDTGKVVPPVPPGKVDAVIGVKIKEGFKAMPLVDIKEATILLREIIESCLERGGLPDSDYSLMDFPQSSLTIQRMTANRNDQYIPRLQAFGLYYQRLFHEVMSQLKMIATTRGFKPEYLPGTLREFTNVLQTDTGKYTAKFKFFVVFPETNINNYSIAAAAEHWFDRMTIHKDILHTENPKEVIERKLVQDLEDEVPAFKVYNAAERYLLANDKPRYNILKAYLGASMDMIQAGGVPEGGATPQGGGSTPDATLPLMAGQNKGTATNLKRNVARKTREGAVASGIEPGAGGP